MLDMYPDIAFNVLRYMDLRDTLALKLLCRKFSTIVNSFEIPIVTILILKARPQAPRFSTDGYKFLRGFVLILECDLADFHLSNSILCVVMDSGYRYFKNRLSKFKLVPFYVIWKSRQDARDFGISSNQFRLALFNIAMSFNKCSYIYLNYSRRIPIIPGLKSVFLDNIHSDLDIDFYRETAENEGIIQLGELTLRSEGLFLGNEGYISTSKVVPALMPSLTKLELHGPFLNAMLNNPMSFLRETLNLKNLVSLLLDLDCQRIPLRLVLDLLSLPKLENFGRLYNVDASFWRMVPKVAFANIKTFHAGRIQYPNSEPFIESPNFLNDLGFGIKWAFPNIKNVYIYMGYSRVNTDVLLAVLKLLKFGIPSNSNKSITFVGLFQVFDWKNVDVRNWKYVAEQYCGYRTRVFISDGKDMDSSNSRTFG